MLRASDILFPKPPPLTWQQKHAEAKALAAAEDAAGFGWRDALEFLHRILCPRAMGWSYLVVGKTGSSAVLMALHQLEFGQPLTARIDDSLNEDAIGHRLTDAQLLAPLIEIEGGPARLPAMLRLTSTRHPARRLLSGYLYLCRANRLGAAQFLKERLLMTALTGFDWNLHAGTVDGFLMFLDFLRLADDPAQGFAVDAHLSRQSALVRPAVYRPDVVVRLESMTQDLAEVARRLNRPAPPPAPAANRQPAYDPAPFLLTPQARSLLSPLCEADCAAFGYDADYRAPLLPLPAPASPSGVPA